MLTHQIGFLHWSTGTPLSLADFYECVGHDRTDLAINVTVRCARLTAKHPTNILSREQMDTQTLPNILSPCYAADNNADLETTIVDAFLVRWGWSPK